MARRLVEPSLRRSLVMSAVALVIVATLAMLVAFSTTLSLRSEMDRDTDAFIEEQRIADQIAALTYAQQLDAYRFLQSLDGARRQEFRATGDEADAQMRAYLFRALSPAARLQVERMKETHDVFEVLAERGFDLAQRGDTAAARARLALLDRQTAALDTAVARFLDARVAQRSALQEEYRRLTAQVRFGLALVGVALLALVAVLGRHMRRRVVVPLEQLTVAAELIRSGDLLARVPPQRYSELRQVAHAFNEMADSVQGARETVEMQNEELRQSLEQLQDTQNELVQHEKLSAMGQMLAGLAHELNNPLGGVLGLAELLRSELTALPDPAAQRIASELATPLEREAVRARDLVRSLLNFARKTTGRVEAIPLATTVSTAVGLRAHAFVQARKELQLNIPPRLQVMADMQKLQHAIVNVVNNALDAIVGGGGDRLTITATGTDDTARIVFDDDGPGFSDVAAALTPFYTTKPTDKGTGLGLALVQKFIEESGGSVAVSNRPEGGARVSITLRRAPDADAATLSEELDQAPVTVATSTPTDRLGRRPRVLVVDDEPSLREVQRRLLTLEGMDVVLAESSSQALDILARESMDLVVSDLRMPGDTDGLGLIASLERDYPHLAARALLVTGDVSGASAAFNLVPEPRLIRKPFTRQEYVSRVRAALDRDTSRE